MTPASTSCFSQGNWTLNLAHTLCRSGLCLPPAHRQRVEHHTYSRELAPQAVAVSVDFNATKVIFI